MNDERPTGKEGKDREQPYSGRKARQGEIILRSRWSRIIFIAGLVGLALLGIFLRYGGGP